ncbi:MAG: hypothetical protein ACE5FG_05470 [Myxococcota bacterium]
MELALKAIISGCLIAFASWLSGRAPVLAGFLVALPISTALVLPMSYLEHGSFSQTALLAKSILVAVPLTLSFFLPFLLAERLGWGFWLTYALGFVCLGMAFGLHRLVVRMLFGAAA